MAHAIEYKLHSRNVASSQGETHDDGHTDSGDESSDGQGDDENGPAAIIFVILRRLTEFSFPLSTTSVSCRCSINY